MRNALLIAMLILLLPLCGCSDARVDKSLQIDEISFESTLLGKEMLLQIYTPSGYSDNIEYPVLYFMADYGGSAHTVMQDYAIAQRAEELLVKGEIVPLIIVGINIDRSFGINSDQEVESFDTTSGKVFHKGMYADHVCKEIIPLIDSQYSTIASRNGRYIGGYSMGGFAALHISFCNPELFSKAGGHSPSLFIENFPDETVSDWLYPTIELRKERDPIYLAQERDISDLSVFLDVEIGGSMGVKYLYDILVERGVKATFMELSFSHSRTSCYENMGQYLTFYAGFDKTDTFRTE